jgi:hypothetical protein
VKIPRGIVEDVLIKVDKFYFPVDFIVLDTEPVQMIGTEIHVILGRPFLVEANALINCRSGVMKISFGNMTVELNIFHIRKQPLDYDQMNQVCLIEEILDEVIEESSIEDPLEACLAQFGEDLDLEKLMEQADALLETAPLVSKEKEEITVPDSPKKELKPLPDSLKYKFLGPAESLPVIIASDLKDAQDEELLEVLREHKKAIGWTINKKRRERSGEIVKGMSSIYRKILGYYSTIHLPFYPYFTISSTHTITPTHTITSTLTPTHTITSTLTSTHTITSTLTPTHTITSTLKPTHTITPTHTPTNITITITIYYHIIQ